MKTKIFHWVLVLLLSSGIPIDLVGPQTSGHFAAEEDFSSERQDESSKPSASRKRGDRGRKAKVFHPPSRLMTLAYASDILARPHSSPSPPTSLPHLQLLQLHKVFRI